MTDSSPDEVPLDESLSHIIKICKNSLEIISSLGQNESFRNNIDEGKKIDAKFPIYC